MIYLDKTTFFNKTDIFIVAVVNLDQRMDPNKIPVKIRSLESNQTKIKE